MDENIQYYTQGEPIDTSKRVIVSGVSPGWLEYYPEIKDVVLRHPNWEGRRFIIEPPAYLSARALEVVRTAADSSTVPTQAFPFYDQAKLVAVVVHQRGYKDYDSLYTYRLRRRR